MPIRTRMTPSDSVVATYSPRSGRPHTGLPVVDPRAGPFRRRNPRMHRLTTAQLASRSSESPPCRTAFTRPGRTRSAGATRGTMPTTPYKGKTSRVASRTSPRWIASRPGSGSWHWKPARSCASRACCLRLPVRPTWISRGRCWRTGPGSSRRASACRGCCSTATGAVPR